MDEKHFHVLNKFVYLFVWWFNLQPYATIVIMWECILYTLEIKLFLSGMEEDPNNTEHSVAKCWQQNQ